MVYRAISIQSVDSTLLVTNIVPNQRTNPKYRSRTALLTISPVIICSDWNRDINLVALLIVCKEHQGVEF
jgi:hypothetical protein